MTTVGFYGKLPSHGDFLQRRLSDAFVNRWDEWLQECLARSRQDLADSWLETYLTSPVWRFALGSGVVGGAVWAGIILPSVDRVGRYFPMTVAAELAPEANPFAVADRLDHWFDRIETLALDMLEQDVPDPGRFEAELAASAVLIGTNVTLGATGPLPLPGSAASNQCRFPLRESLDLRTFSAEVAWRLSLATMNPLSLWWTVGSARVGPSALLVRGLPLPQSFNGMLDERWSADTQHCVEGDSVARVVESSPVMFHSSAISDTGRWRQENQDAFVERATQGLWAVADGMGGHRDGAMASRLVARHLEAVDLDGDLPRAARRVEMALQSANAELRARATDEPEFAAGSTVVVLLLGDSRGIVLWAGDSRAYLLRDGGMEQLTRDHSAVNESPLGAEEASEPSHIITRAIGGTDSVEIDRHEFEARPGDRYLLCSDGLTSAVGNPEIAATLKSGECGTAVSRLLSLALERGSRDNVTTVVIDRKPVESTA